MPIIEVDAYDSRHPEHETMLALECDKGLDIELLPTFKVEIEVRDTAEESLPRS
jgi:hypothetical protein